MSNLHLNLTRVIIRFCSILTQDVWITLIIERATNILFKNSIYLSDTNVISEINQRKDTQKLILEFYQICGFGQ